LALSRRQRLLIFKLSALLSLVRWYNIFFLALSQYLAVLFVLNDIQNWKETLLNVNLHYIVFASLFCVAGGYLINNFYDLERDLINRPNKTLYEKLVKQSTSLRLYFLFNLIGALLALSVSLNVFLFFSAFIFFLWFYSHKLKKIAFIGNLAASALAITPFFAIFIYYNLEDLLIFTYVSFILIVILIREIIKDLEALKGDIILGYDTLPTTIGVRETKLLILFLTLLSFVPAALIFYKTGFTGASYYLIPGETGLVISLLALFPAQRKEDYALLNNIFRLLIIGGILSLMLLSR
jgi:4-hydroxybenzoate polyprenyltransferase